MTHRAYFREHLPKPKGWVNDFEGILSEDDADNLAAAIISLNAAAKAQFCIVTIDTAATSAEGFDSLVRHIANVWGVGGRGINNGITIGLCRGYHRIRICNGNGIAARLSDEETKTIIDTQIIPLFKKEEYCEGLLTGLDTLAMKLSARP